MLPLIETVTLLAFRVGLTCSKSVVVSPLIVKLIVLSFLTLSGIVIVAVNLSLATVKSPKL